MAGTWTTQNKVLPGPYLNFKTNAALSITPGDRGIVALLQEMSVGTAGEMYTITVLDSSEYPTGVTAADKLLVNEALKGAKTVIVYNLGTSHDATVLGNALTALKIVDFDVLVYPYTGTTYATNQATVEAWITAMRDDEGLKIQGVMANYIADNEAVINVAQGVKLSDNTDLTAAQCTAWVGGITAGANVNESNTGKKYSGAIDVSPRMTKSEQEAAITAGKMIFKVDTAQNVSIVYDINSLTTFTAEKSKVFRKNRVIRTIDGINNDIAKIFEANYIGKVNNNADGRSLLKASLVGYFMELERIAAIQNFVPDDITVSAGTDSDAVVIDCYIQLVDSAEKIYITINLA
jgi:hypothetical protein